VLAGDVVFHSPALEFEAALDDKLVHGVDILRWFADQACI
jgi:hypothetical protein